MGGALLVARVDEARLAASGRGQHGNVGAGAQTEFVFDAPACQPADELVRDRSCDGTPLGCRAQDGRLRCAGPLSAYGMLGGIGPSMRPPCRNGSHAGARMPTERDRMNSPRPSSGANPSLALITAVMP